MQGLCKGFHHAPINRQKVLLNEFARDTNPNKINLVLGVYQDESGSSTRLDSVSKATKLVNSSTLSTPYHYPQENASFLKSLDHLHLGLDWKTDDNHQRIRVQSLGGIGALSLAFKLIRDLAGGVYSEDRTVGSSFPACESYHSIARSSNFSWKTLPYFSAKIYFRSGKIAFEQFYESLDMLKPLSILLLQTGCHNPTGADFSFEEWELIRQRVRKRHIIPVLDCAYQGFGIGLEADATPVRIFLDDGQCVFIAYSCSKNFGLYRERVGALIVQTESQIFRTVAESRANYIVESHYGAPPFFGPEVVATILNNADLRGLWIDELCQMRARLDRMRKLFVDGLYSSSEINFSSLNNLSGMFLTTGLTPSQVALLRESGIYIAENGRLCLSGLNDGNVDRVTAEIGKVIKDTRLFVPVPV